jgi:hypothetical protein
VSCPADVARKDLARAKRHAVRLALLTLAADLERAAAGLYAPDLDPFMDHDGGAWARLDEGWRGRKEGLCEAARMARERASKIVIVGER